MSTKKSKRKTTCVAIISSRIFRKIDQIKQLFHWYFPGFFLNMKLHTKKPADEKFFGRKKIGKITRSYMEFLVFMKKQ